jgi:hypothetical protein
MSIGSIINLSSYLQSALATTLQVTGLSNANSGNSLTGIGGTPSAQPDNSQLSPFAQLMSTLQQLQQSNPGKYQQVTQQISANLQSAAQTAQSQGNTSAANQLNQLATDFTSASQSGQLPNVQDLAQAAGAHHHHHHHHGGSAESSSTTSGTASTNQSADSLLAAFQASATQNDALNPMAIIANALSSAGIATTNS